MRIAMLYYSASGTTKLVCEVIRERLPDQSIELFDMKETRKFDWSEYDVFGFAYFADLLRPSPFFLDFVSKIQGVEGKNAFLINTFGSTGGRAPQIAFERLRERGMIVFASHSLHTPESFPPLIMAGFGFSNHPTAGEINRFEAYVSQLHGYLIRVEAGERLASSPPKLDLVSRLAPRDLAGLLPRQFGPRKFEIIEAKCVKCGKCARYCPGNAISLADSPRIDHARCQQCWACYSACPKQAIRVGKLQGEAQYHGPSASLREKLMKDI